MPGLVDLLREQAFLPRDLTEPVQPSLRVAEELKDPAEQDQVRVPDQVLVNDWKFDFREQQARGPG